MNNYEYILASLPEPDAKDIDAGALMEEVKSLLDGRDLKEFSLLEEYYAEDGPCVELYRKASRSHCSFIREYFEFDRSVRNTKVAYLNSRLGRPEGTDLVLLGEEEEPVLNEEASAALRTEDTLEREKALDELMWKKAAALTEMKNFSLDLIISYVLRFKITDRWLRLDEETGRTLLRKLIQEIKNSSSKI